MDTMRDLLRGHLGRSLRAMREVDRLAAAWPVACGRSMAARGTVVGFEAGVVLVEVEGTLWRQQMISMRSALARDLGEIAGVRVSGIHFQVKTGQGSGADG